MKRWLAYDRTRDPPAPVMSLLVAAPGSAEAVAVPSLVDTGADCTLIPAAVARSLGLPLIDRLRLEGFGGATQRAPVHAAIVRVAGRRTLARLIAYDTEAIIGRDLLNQLEIRLDGPRLRLSFG